VLAGGTCDGQYIRTPQFREHIKDKLGLENCHTIFSLPVTWDAAHLFHLSVDDLMEGKRGFRLSSDFIKRVLKRVKVLSTEIGIGKGDATRRYLGSKFSEKTFAISSYAQQR